MKTQQPNPNDYELRFTQNFLHSKALVERIVNLAHLQPGCVVLEIGPGKGIITQKLAEKVTKEGRVIAVELDAALANTLRETFREMPQVEVVNVDILRFKLDMLPSGYAVFSNIPFNITSELLEYLFDPKCGPAEAHLILQKDTLIGMLPYQPGVATETFKSLMIKPLYTLELVHTFAKSDFFPQPGIETGLFAFTKQPKPLINPAQYDLYKDFLAFVSKDRVGEGVWTRVFTKNQLVRLATQHDLVQGRGLKSQSQTAMVSAFEVFAASNKANLEVVRGAMARLREEQQRKDQLNRIGGHRRPTPSTERDTRIIPDRKPKKS